MANPDAIIMFPKVQCVFSYQTLGEILLALVQMCIIL